MGPYTLEAELGRGGMGVVYRARGPFGRAVALKVLLDADAEALERFRREARTGLALRHPSVVPVRDAGTADGRPYVVMDLLPGPDLARRLREGPLPVADAIGLALDVARVLEVAHGQGIVHRDLKPANVLFDAEGAPRLTDFGLAALVRTGERLTVTGEVLGTPGYMAPEQAEGLPGARLGPACDVYGLGATLYAALTGEPPFRGSSPLATLRRVLEEPPTPPSRLRPEVPADVEAICLRCLAKAPGERYPTAGALALALERALESRTGPRGSPRSRRALVGVGGALLVLAAGAGALAAGWRGADDDAAAASAGEQRPGSEDAGASPRDGSPGEAAPESTPADPAPAAGGLEAEARHVERVRRLRSEMQAAVRAERFRDALDAANELVALRPGDPAGACYRVGILAALERWEDVLARCRELLRPSRRLSRSRRAELSRRRGQALEKLGRAEESIEAHGACAELRPGDPEPWVRVARIAVAAKLEPARIVRAAERALEHADEGTRLYWWARQLRGTARYRAHEDGEAIDDLHAFLREYREGHVATNMVLGSIYSRLGRPQEALDHLRLVRPRAGEEGVPAASVHLARALARLGKHDEALGALEPSLRGRHGEAMRARARRVEAHVLLWRSELDGFLRALTSAAEDLPEGGGSFFGWLAVCRARLELERPAAAGEALVKARALCAPWGRAAVTAAEAALALAEERPEDALELAGRALERDPRSRLAGITRVRALRALGRSHEALEAARDAVELHPSGVSPRIELAGLLLAADDAGEALETLRRLVARHPDHFQARVYAAMARAMQGRLGEAREHLEHARGLAGRMPPDSPAAKKLDALTRDLEGLEERAR